MFDLQGESARKLPFAAALIVATTVIWWWIYKQVVRHPLDPMAITLYYLALQLIWRPAVLALGLDTPFPTEVFAGRNVAYLMTSTQLMVILFLVSLFVGARLLGPLPRLAMPAFPRTRHTLSRRELLLIAVAITGLALLVTVQLWAKHGGPTGLLRASKVNHDLVSSRALRSLPLLAALFSAAAFHTPNRLGGRGRRSAALLLVVINAYLSFTWGARDVPVFSAVILLGGSLLFSQKSRERARRLGDRLAYDNRLRRRLVVVAVAGIGLAFGLRTARDTLLWNGVAPTIEGQTAMRQIAVATNNVFFDTSLLIVGDWPDTYRFHNGADFVDGVKVSLPGSHTEFTSPAVSVAQTYLDRNNGFPATPLGDWYLNFGRLGVLLGGLFSGFLIRAAQMSLSRFEHDPLTWAFSVILMGRVFPGGYWAVSAPKWVAFAVPMIAMSIAINLVFDTRQPPAVVRRKPPGMPAASNPGS